MANKKQSKILSKPHYAVWDIEPLKVFPSNRENFYFHLVGWAILAPNSHNVQPWRFILCPNQRCIDVCVDPKGILPASDLKARQAHISVGCAAQNLVFAAEYYGLAPKLEFISGEAVYPSPILRVEFNKSGKISKKMLPWLRAIKSRRMNRSKFDPLRPIPQKFINSAEKTCRDLKLAFSGITDTPTRFAIAETQYIADRTVIARTEFRRELAEFLLPNDSGEPRGMPGNTFGLSDKMANYVNKELKKESAFDPDLAAGFASEGRDGIRSSPFLGMISVKKDSPFEWLRAGMAFQKICLLAEQKKISIAVHAAIVEVDLFNKMLRLRLMRRERPTVIFRMGYTTENRPHSPRLEVREVIELVD